MTHIDRRSFLRRAGMLAASSVVATAGLERLSQRMAAAAPAAGSGQDLSSRKRGNGYGDIAPRSPINADEPWLALPEHFSYAVLSRIGDPMSDGTFVPRSCDGMGAFADGRHGVRL